MTIPADSSFSSFCPYSSCLSLCLKNTGKLPVFLHIIPQSLQALFRIRAEKNNKQVVFLRTLSLHSLRFERNGDKGDSTLTFFFLNASQTLNHRTISTLWSLESQNFSQGRKQYPSLWSLVFDMLREQAIIFIWEFSQKVFFTWKDNIHLQFSCSVISNSLQPHALQQPRPPCPSPTPRVYPNSCHWVGDAIQLSHPLSLPSPPALNLSQHQGLFQGVSSSNQVAKVLEFQL